MTNLFPLPYWAPALQRVPILLQALNETFAHGNRSLAGEQDIITEKMPNKVQARARPSTDNLPTATASKMSEGKAKAQGD